MSDNEIEDVSFLPGESLHRKAVYEPSILQKIKISFCSRGKLAVFTLISCLLILILALLIALASDTCDNKPQSQTIQHEGKDKSQDLKQDYIATNGKPFPYTDIRLPHNIIPIHYNLFLHPNITQSYFKGKVEIDCEVKQSTNYVVFHLKDLNITNLEMRDGVTGTVYLIKEYMEYRTNEQIYVSLRERISSGTKVTIKVEFEGHLIRKLAGFYKSMYKTKAGVERYIATTHFEATDARTAFPCFDEPALKATFSLTMVREPAYKALFNMPLLKSTPYGQGLVQDMFQTSVKMSTYLVAFIVCDYEGIFNKTKRNITVGVYTPPDSISSAEFALQAAVKIIDYYEEFFGINYPLPKQDLVAIPDFAAGAMENWGLITYRMTSILYDPKIASAKNREWVTIVIAHELAHQWFGNLVTMKWWDDLWLNEGFASYVEYIGSAVVNEEWNMVRNHIANIVRKGTFGIFQKVDFLTSIRVSDTVDGQDINFSEELFLVSTQLKAEYLDCLKNSHPINLPVENPNQINELFDSIIYDKGASIIRMLSKFLGDDKFKAGLTAYLNRFHYSNAVTNDLWSSLSEAASQSNKGTDVKSIMQTWTEQAGYPVITMETRGNVVTLTQSRFLLYDSPNTTEPYKSKFGYVWEVPFSYRTSQDPNSIKKLLLKKKTGSFKVESKTTWIHGNPEMFGYYRVNYDKSGWEAIIKELNRYPKIFSSVERAGFIDDAFSLAQGGLLKYSTVFTLLEYMVHEEDYLPWQTLMDNIAYIQRRIENKPAHTNFVKYLLKLMKNQLDQTVWEDSGKPLEKYLRSVILSKAVYLGDTVSIERGKKYFQDWKKNHNGINVNLKSTIFHTGVMYGEEKDWETVWTAYLNETIPSEKRRLLQALGYTRDARQLDRLLMYSLNESLIRSQDTHTLVSTVASKPAGQILAWRFFQRNWEIFSSRYSRAAFTMGGIVKSIGSSFDTEFDYNEFKNFFTTRDAGTGTMAVRQTLEKIQMNIDWSKKYEKEVTDWLKEHGN